MTEWREVESLARVPEDRILLRGDGHGKFVLDISANLVTAPRVTVLTDDKGRLALRFSPDGSQSAYRTGNMRSVRRVGLRKAASRLFPANFTGPVPWHREDGMIVIDPRNIHEAKVAAE